jgi:hypothetical protein
MTGIPDDHNSLVSRKPGDCRESEQRNEEDHLHQDVKTDDSNDLLRIRRTLDLGGVSYISQSMRL